MLIRCLFLSLADSFVALSLARSICPGISRHLVAQYFPRFMADISARVYLFFLGIGLRSNSPDPRSP